MSWFTQFLTSSIGRKLLMSLTGLFLIVFLLVHLAGNIQLLTDSTGASFNEYAQFMTTNPVIKFTSYGLYFFILLHIVQGLIIWSKNRTARGSQGYAVKVTRATQTNGNIAKRMGALGSIIMVFLGLHLYQFWYKMHWQLEPDTANGVKDLYSLVNTTYQDPLYVAIYVISMIVIAFHLWHGFQSAFQTLGINHKKYTPFIQVVGKIYAILIPLGFAIIPILMYFNK
jgi:succinate dehydrogenase / fumarate reductase cytochrome b subunit